MTSMPASERRHSGSPARQRGVCASCGPSTEGAVQWSREKYPKLEPPSRLLRSPADTESEPFLDAEFGQKMPRLRLCFLFHEPRQVARFVKVQCDAPVLDNQHVRPGIQRLTEMQEETVRAEAGREEIGGCPKEGVSSAQVP